MYIWKYIKIALCECLEIFKLENNINRDINRDINIDNLIEALNDI